MRYLVEPTPATGLKEGDIFYSPYNLFCVKKVSQVTDSHVSDRFRMKALVWKEN